AARAGRPPLPPPTFSPPSLVLSDFLLLVRRQVGTRLGDGMQLWQAYAGAELVDALRIGERPGSNPTVARIVQPLRAETLGTTFGHRDAILEIGRVPCRDAALGRALLHPLQRPALEFRLPHRVLSDQPGRLRTVLAGSVFGGPAVLVDELSQAAGIPDVNRLHARDIG